MLDSTYLHTLRYQVFEGLAGKILVVPHHLSGWRYVCTYGDGKSCKSELFKKINQYGQKETPGDWEFHHIVEGNHLANIDFDGRLAMAYANDLPCIMIHKDEHSLYSRLFRLKAARIVFMDDIKGNEKTRAVNAREVYQQPNGRQILLNRLKQLSQMYDQAYHGDVLLQTIAQNVFRKVKNKI